MLSPSRKHSSPKCPIFSYFISVFSHQRVMVVSTVTYGKRSSIVLSMEVDWKQESFLLYLTREGGQHIYFTVIQRWNNIPINQ